MKKLFFLLLLISAGSALAMSGCGRNNAPALVLPAVAASPVYPNGYPNGTLPGSGLVPVGCYHNGVVPCAPCPMGFLQQPGQPGFCAPAGATGANLHGCPMGSFNNGFGCQPIGVQSTCFSGMAWSPYYNGCFSMTMTTLPGPNCRRRSFANGMAVGVFCW